LGYFLIFFLDIKKREKVFSNMGERFNVRKTYFSATRKLIRRENG